MYLAVIDISSIIIIVKYRGLKLQEAVEGFSRDLPRQTRWMDKVEVAGVTNW